MADRTANTTWENSTDPNLLFGKVNASNGDTFKILYGKGLRFIPTSVDDNDAIVSGSFNDSGSQVTLGCIGDDGNAVTTDFNINFIIVLNPQ